MNSFDRYRFQDFPWLDKDFDQTMEFLKDENDRELGLYLPQKGVNADKLKELLILAAANGFMHALMLDNNEIGDEGCKLLGEYLKTDKNLKYLFLEKNKITNKGLEYLLEGLSENTTLKSFWVGRNEIDDNGVATFSEYISSNEVIKEFSVGGKEMTDDGAFCVARALNNNNTLTSVHLLDNSVEWDGARLLAEVASRHQHCNTIEVHSDKMPAQKFSDMLKNMAATESKKAFEQAVKNGEEGPWLRSKIMVVGQGRAGKTATVRSMLNMPFEENLASTVGAAISQSTTKKTEGANWEVDEQATNKTVDLAVDAASRLAVLKMQRKRNEQAEAFNKMTIDEMREHFKQKKAAEQELIRKQQLAGSNIIPKDIQEEINQKFNATLVTNKNTSLEDIAFTIWDYGGQKVFYTLHHLFLTKYGIYILAFDMRDVLCPEKKYKAGTEEMRKGIIERQKQTKEYLEFWLNSVYMHATEAPMMIVGTFLDFPGCRHVEAIRQVDRFIKNILGDKFPQVVKNKGLHFFPLSNKEPARSVDDLTQAGGRGGKNIDTIRDTIEEVARQQDFVNQKLSLRWIKLLDKMLSIDKDFLYFKEVQDKAKTCGIVNVSEVEKLLKFFHELGMIVHIDSTQNLREIVTTKPQWLINELSKVIRDSQLHRYDENELKKRGLLQMYQQVLDKSIVTKDWLEYLWPRERVGFLIDLMRRTMLISDWKFGEYADDNAFLVPSLIEKENEDAQKLAKKYLAQFKKPGETEEEQLAKVNAAQGFYGKIFKLAFRGKKGKKGKQGEPLEIAEQGAKLEEIDFTKPPKKEEAKGGEAGEGEAPKEGEGENAEQAEEEEKEIPQGFYSKEEVRSIVFDFRKSYLPNGVFQRLLCLCILKCTNDNQTKIAPTLFRSSAVIHMGGKGATEQVFEIYKHEKQILCKVKRDFLGSYKVLLSMMQKLKADVMGTGLEWDVYLETVDKNDVKEEGEFHSFKPYSEVHEKKLSPWFHEGTIKNEDEMMEQVVGIELEAFLEDLNDF